mmetsp:Transcript_36699/g.96102  ORF Transcript_36699/g.96102 Transcript_36699/m.96102 type:complete len:126 (-) Transcript_36699:50-427(-)
MGRKKSKRKPPAKKAGQKLAEVFDCPFCNHEGSCKVTINTEKNVGSIKCSICDEDFQCRTNQLSDPIDVYTNWIDACDEANQAAEADGGAAADDTYAPYVDDVIGAASAGRDDSDDDGGLIDYQP